MTTSAQEAVKLINSGDNVFVHSAAAVPQILVNAMAERHKELKNVSIYQIHTEGPALYAQPAYVDSFSLKTFL